MHTCVGDSYVLKLSSNLYFICKCFWWINHIEKRANFFIMSTLTLLLSTSSLCGLHFYICINLQCVGFQDYGVLFLSFDNILFDNCRLTCPRKISRSYLVCPKASSMRCPSGNRTSGSGVSHSSRFAYIPNFTPREGRRYITIYLNTQ